MMDFITAIKTCFSKYAIFQGRAARSEFWWWFLFGILLNTALWAISRPLQIVAGAALFLPNLAVSVRRLHDTDRSAWFLLLPVLLAAVGMAIFFLIGTAGMAGVFSPGVGSAIVAFISGIIAIGGYLLLLIWFCQKGTPGPNRYGDAPLTSLPAPHVQPTVVS
jgi:uncharacterized membrane protein YhaH (DUF805 family)